MNKSKIHPNSNYRFVQQILDYHEKINFNTMSGNGWGTCFGPNNHKVGIGYKYHAKEFGSQSTSRTKWKNVFFWFSREWK